MGVIKRDTIANMSDIGPKSLSIVPTWSLRELHKYPKP